MYSKYIKELFEGSRQQNLLYEMSALEWKYRDPKCSIASKKAEKRDNPVMLGFLSQKYYSN